MSDQFMFTSSIFFNSRFLYSPPVPQSTIHKVIIFAKKGGNGPTELMPGLILYNQQGELTKKAKLPSEIGIFNLYKQFI